MKKLSEKQRKVLEKIVKSGITKEGFYLAGGTALALKYNHRVSEDFDFFSETFSKDFFLHYLSAFQKECDLKVEVFKDDTLIFFLEGVKCSFFYYPYKLIKPVKKISLYEEEHDDYITVASDEDIAGMKTIAIIQRGTKKDFYDLWFLMKIHNWSLNRIKEICKAKYGNLFPESAFERAIIYFEDAEKESFPEIDPLWEEIKAFFINVIKRSDSLGVNNKNIAPESKNS